MKTPFRYIRWWIGTFCGLIFLLEILAPIEYVFGHLYIIPILLAACELSDRGESTTKILSITSLITKFCVFLTLLDFLILEIVNYNLLSFSFWPISTTINRINVIVVLLVSNWMIQSSLKYMEKIYLQKEDIRRYQSELLAQKKIDRLHEDFVFTLTHDLKTPLIGAIQTIKYFQQEKFGSINSTQAQVLATMSRSQQLSLQLVETMLDVYRNDTEGLEIQHQSIDLYSIARESIDSIIILGTERQIQVKLNCNNLPAKPPKLHGDRLQLSRVFSNLLSNAIYHSPRGGKIDVTIYYRDRHYIVEVLDRGRGILPVDLPFIFDRFYKARNQLKGSGLGLHLSRQIIEAHDGKIWVESVLPQGAKFCFSLPIEN
jgi:two-component system, NarL family, sensor kinase